jgi:hypothetical protein
VNHKYNFAQGIIVFPAQGFKEERKKKENFYTESGLVSRDDRLVGYLLFAR